LNNPQQPLNELSTQAETVIFFLQRLDANMLDALLTDELTYQEFPKSHFIQLLERAFQKFRDAGDNFLNGYPGTCNMKTCNFGCTGYAFVGNHSGSYMNLILDIRDTAVLDIYECGKFKCPEAPRSKRKRILLDT